MTAPSAFFLVGCTAAGKSAVAHWLARRNDLDVLSADSMQVYRGMDIGTAKPSRAERSEVAYFGLDLVTPDKIFSVSQYRDYACDVLRKGARTGRKTIVAGGSGLYVKSLTHGLASAPRPDPQLREHWNRIIAEKGVESLQEALKKRSPDLFLQVNDKMNPRRLIRALEMAELNMDGDLRSWRNAGVSVPLVGLAVPQRNLESRIEARVDRMYRSGLVDEVRGLLDRYPDLSDTARQAIGYAEAIDCLQGRCSEKEAHARTIVRTRQLAKKQRTWFRHQANVCWIDVKENMDVAVVAGKAWEKLEEHGPVRIAE